MNSKTTELVKRLIEGLKDEKNGGEITIEKNGCKVSVRKNSFPGSTSMNCQSIRTNQKEVKIFKNPNDTIGRIQLEDEDGNLFIERGKKIKKGETLFLIKEVVDIHTHKMRYHEIKTPENMTIVEVMVKNEAVIDYGKKIFSYTNL